MLLQFSIENCLSFKNKIIFSMFANGTKGLENNYVEVMDKKVLKTSAIYGPNASGKSNLFKILNLISSMIRQSSNIDINAKLPITPFKFKNNDDLSKFEIEFIKDDIRYVYGFFMNEKEIKEEYLYYYPNGREAKIFERTNINEYSFPQADLKILNEIKCKTADNKFFLSTATNWNYKKTKPAYDFLTIDLGVFFNTEELKNLSFKAYANDPSGDLKKFALDFLKKADFNISDYEVSTIDIPKEVLATIKESLKGITTFQTRFKHIIEGNEYLMDYKEESIGTQILFNLIPFMFKAMENKHILIIDELDKSLHPFLIQYIVSIFNDPSINKNGAQLIFNTHDTNLLDLNLLRRDQIWFTEKSSETGASDLYSLSDFNVRNKENIEKGYLLGRYGAIPFINTDINLWRED